MGIMQDLVQSLGYCCVRSFLEDVKPYSARRLGQALGVSHHTVQYWRDKLILHELPRCSTDCPQRPYTPPELQRTDGGTFRFVRYDVD